MESNCDAMDLPYKHASNGENLELGKYALSDDDYYDDNDELDLSAGLAVESAKTPNLAGNPGKLRKRGAAEHSWSPEATRTLIQIRGPLEGHFTEGRQKRTVLWRTCWMMMSKQGYRFRLDKVQKKWHNILITYNKNLVKRNNGLAVQWEFFEDMYQHLKGKEAANFDSTLEQDGACGQGQLQPNSGEQFDFPEPAAESTTVVENKRLLYEHLQDMSAHLSNDDFDEDSTIESSIDQQHDHQQQHQQHQQPELKYDASFGTARADQQFWWKDFFKQKLQLEQQRVQLQKQMHRDQIALQRAALLQQTKTERLKIDAINNLTSTLQKLVDINSTASNSKPQNYTAN